MGNSRVRPSLSWWWIAAACGVVIFCLIASGCQTVSDADLASLDGQLAAWRVVREEGRTWDDDTWEARLADYAAECRVLRAKLAGDVEAGSFFAFRAEEADRGR